MKRVLGPNESFCHFLKVASLVFLDIAQDCSLGPPKKTFVAQIGVKMIFSILMLSSAHLNLLDFKKEYRMEAKIYWPVSTLSKLSKILRALCMAK